MKLKENVFHKYEKTYVNEVITNHQRIDGREADEYRKLDIQFGKEWGVCIVSLGETKVMAQVTCEVQQPKTVRPNEGLLFLNVEISQMAAPNIEQSNLSELHVHLSRLLEKCIKESHCVDLESLCIVAEEKVWNVRVDIVILNYDGNMIGGSSIAALAALSHFRRPDVTIDGETVVIHTSEEKDLIPLSIRHYPIAICFVIFENGRLALSDPTDIEERAAQAELVLGMNAYEELCGIYLAGAVLQEVNVLIKCAKKAANIACTIVQQIKTAVELDGNRRKEKTVSCLVEKIDVHNQAQASQSRSFLSVATKTREDVIDNLLEINISDDDDVEIISLGHNSAEVVNKKKDKRKNSIAETTKNDNSDDVIDISNEMIIKENEAFSSSDDDVLLVGEITNEDRIIERIELSGDSEEETVLTMMPNCH